MRSPAKFLLIIVAVTCLNAFATSCGKLGGHGPQSGNTSGLKNSIYPALTEK